MSTLAFITRFRELHDKAKKGVLADTDRSEYQRSRAELGRLLHVAQQMSHGGKTLRSALRIAQLVKVELDIGGRIEKTTTIDLASGGFAALLATPLAVGRESKFKMFLPALAGSGTTPVEGVGKVASTRAQGTLHRVSFAFAHLEPPAREHLEIAIIDAVLQRFTMPG